MQQELQALAADLMIVAAYGLLLPQAVLDAPRDARGVAVDADRDAVVHRDGQRLGATHAAEAGGERGVVDGDGDRSEEFDACDPYLLMVESVSSRIRGGDDWVLPLSTSLEVARTLDDVRERACS